LYSDKNVNSIMPSLENIPAPDSGYALIITVLAIKYRNFLLTITFHGAGGKLFSYKKKNSPDSCILKIMEKSP